MSCDFRSVMSYLVLLCPFSYVLDRFNTDARMNQPKVAKYLMVLTDGKSTGQSEMASYVSICLSYLSYLSVSFCLTLFVSLGLYHRWKINGTNVNGKLCLNMSVLLFVSLILSRALFPSWSVFFLFIYVRLADGKSTGLSENASYVSISLSHSLSVLLLVCLLFVYFTLCPF